MGIFTLGISDKWCKAINLENTSLPFFSDGSLWIGIIQIKTTVGELECEKLDIWKLPALIANYFNMWKVFIFQTSTG